MLFMKGNKMFPQCGFSNTAVMILKSIPAEKIALHLHDTRGTALANVLVGLEMGITNFDASVGSLGGCPYAPGASGNAASDDLVHLFEAMGETTGIEIDALASAGVFMSERLGRELPGRYHRFHLLMQTLLLVQTR